MVILRVSSFHFQEGQCTRAIFLVVLIVSIIKRVKLTPE